MHRKQFNLVLVMHVYHSNHVLLTLQAFGFPLLVCHVNGKPESFFGSDRFELMAHCIGE